MYVYLQSDQQTLQSATRLRPWTNLFLLYTADLLQLVWRHQLHPHSYANNTQNYGSCHPSKTDALQQHLSLCVNDVSQWMRSNWRQLKPTKRMCIYSISATDSNWQHISAASQCHWRPCSPPRCRRTNGCTWHSNCQNTFYSSVWCSLSREALQTLICKLVISKPHYCNSPPCWCMGIGIHIESWALGVFMPKRTSIHAAIFAGRRHMTNTDWQTHYMHSMWLKNWQSCRENKK